MLVQRFNEGKVNGIYYEPTIVTICKKKSLDVSYTQQ